MIEEVILQMIITFQLDTSSFSYLVVQAAIEAEAGFRFSF